MAEARTACASGACFLAHQWWGHEGRYCAERATCWRLACRPTPVTIHTTAAA